MAVFQPRRAAIATILVTVMQDNICEELLGRHKRGRTKEWIRRRDEKGMNRLVEELRAEDLDFFLDFSAFLTFSLSASLSSEYSLLVLATNLSDLRRIKRNLRGMSTRSSNQPINEDALINVTLTIKRFFPIECK